MQFNRKMELYMPINLKRTPNQAHKSRKLYNKTVKQFQLWCTVQYNNIWLFAILFGLWMACFPVFVLAAFFSLESHLFRAKWELNGRSPNAIVARTMARAGQRGWILNEMGADTADVLNISIDRAISGRVFFIVSLAFISPFKLNIT